MSIFKDKSPLQNAKGATRDLTSNFIHLRKRSQNKSLKNVLNEEEQKIRDRFKPLNQKFGKSKKAKEKVDDDEDLERKGLRSSTLSDDSCNTQDSIKSERRNEKLPVLPTKATDNSLENEGQYGKDSLPPEYIDIQEEIETNLKQCEIDFNTLKKLQAQRLRISFDTDEKQEQELQNQIFDISRKITKTIKESEQGIQRLKKSSDTEQKSDEQIKRNIMTILASKLKDLALKFKQNEKHFYVKVKEFHGDDDQVQKQKEIDDQYFETELQTQRMEPSIQARYKDEEINNLVKSINDLATIFKDLSVLVVEQGTILDRIDYNVECAKNDTREAVKHIEAVRQSEKSTRAQKCIYCQLTTIGVLVLVIIIKFAL